jgi:hypothetical protein
MTEIRFPDQISGIEYSYIMVTEFHFTHLHFQESRRLWHTSSSLIVTSDRPIELTTATIIPTAAVLDSWGIPKALRS